MSGFYSTLIKPIRDQRMDSLIRSLDPVLMSPWDQNLNLAERLIPVERFRKNLLSWAKDSLIGLDQFDHSYVVNGNTEYLNHVIGFGQGSIGWKRGDYSYYPYIAQATKRVFVELDSDASDAPDELIASWPGYAHGDSAELDFIRQYTATHKHLDVSYLGTTAPLSTNVLDFDTVGVSLSKTLCIPFNRIAMVFSRREIPSLSVLNRIGYVNLAGVNIANHLMENLSSTYMWDTYSHHYHRLMAEHGLQPTNCLLIAYDGNGRRVSTAQVMQKVMM
jgi:hypothetical protein